MRRDLKVDEIKKMSDVVREFVPYTRALKRERLLCLVLSFGSLKILTSVEQYN